MKKFLLETLLLIIVIGLASCSSNNDDNSIDFAVLNETTLTAQEWTDGTYNYYFYKNHSLFVTRAGSGRITSGSQSYTYGTLIGSWSLKDDLLTLTVYGKTDSNMNISTSLRHLGNYKFETENGELQLTGGNMRSDNGDNTSHDRAAVGTWNANLAYTSTTDGTKYNVSLTLTLNSDGSGRAVQTGDLTSDKTITWTTSKGMITINGVFDTSFYRIGDGNDQMIFYADNGAELFRFNKVN